MVARLPPRSGRFQEWLLEQPSSVVADISRKERDWARDQRLGGRAPYDAYEDSLQGYADRDRDALEEGVDTLRMA
jgi:hypothetical protein